MLENVAIANASQLEGTRATPALSRFNYDAIPSLKLLNLSVAALEHFCCWYITLCCHLDLWPSDLDLWPWTSAAYRLWCDETLYQIWTQSINPWWSYCGFSVWPYDLEHWVTLCTQLWINFHQVWPSITYPHLNYSVFWYWYVMSRCDLDLCTFSLPCKN